MADLRDLAKRYTTAGERLEGLPDVLEVDLLEWSSGDLAMEHFGRGADVLDSLYLLTAYEIAVRSALVEQVTAARIEGHSWSEIAIALGVSRQAVRKRFGKYLADFLLEPAAG